MDLKIGIIFFVLILEVFCEVDYSSLINSTQQLQNIERGGVINIYPALNFSDNSIDGGNVETRGDGRPFYFGSVLHPTSVPLPATNNPSFPEQQPDFTSVNATNRPFYYGSFIHPTKNSSKENEKFLNKTRNSMSNGICTKEVPTASLLKKNDHPVAGNGSDPSLSRIQVCCEGYERDAHILRKCNPICSAGCLNGICTAPETCTCYPNYVKNFNGQCISTCPNGCENGACNPDNSCSCNEGFELEPNGKFCTIKCKDGYRAINGICQPFCSRGCENGFCAAPEQCECREVGWVLDGSRTKCVPKCDRTCLNGFCSSPNSCTCKSGYAKDIVDQYRCNPMCNPQCENAICSGPNMCLCYQGYVKDRNVRGGSKCVKL